MTTITTKEAATEALETLSEQFEGALWLKSLELDTDDHGWCITIKVKSREQLKESGIILPRVVGTVKVCTLYSN